MTRHEVVLPDLGVAGRAVTTGLWLVRLNDPVERGEAILEVLTGAAVVDLPATTDGILSRKLVSEDQLLVPGQPLAWIETADG